jgi:hypothetical protein
MAHNPVARELRSPEFRQRIVKDRTKYDRKAKAQGYAGEDDGPATEVAADNSSRPGPSLPLSSDLELARIITWLQARNLECHILKSGIEFRRKEPRHVG